MKIIKPFEPVRKDEIPSGDWITQIKWDGVRILIYYDGSEIRLFNRKKNERTKNYPELLDIKSYCKADSVILDGEIIALGSDGKPSFHDVMRRDGIRKFEKVEYMKSVVPITYMIFDVIYFDGEWINKRPLIERLDILSNIIEPNNHVQVVSPHEDPESLFEVIVQQGMEGIVMKKPAGEYTIGGKNDAWIKVKNYRDLIAVIGGFTLSGGIINSILLGLYDSEGKLHYIGHTGTGKLSNEDWRQLTKALIPTTIEERPFINKPDRERNANWVEPRLTVKIMYAEWTAGHSLRQPSIQAFVDASPEQCVFEDDMLRGWVR